MTEEFIIKKHKHHKHKWQLIQRYFEGDIFVFVCECGAKKSIKLFGIPTKFDTFDAYDKFDIREAKHETTDN